MGGPPVWLHPIERDVCNWAVDHTGHLSARNGIYNVSHAAGTFIAAASAAAAAAATICRLAIGRNVPPSAAPGPSETCHAEVAYATQQLRVWLERAVSLLHGAIPGGSHTTRGARVGWMQYGTHAPPADDDGNANSLEAASTVWWSHTVCRPIVLCAAMLLVVAPWLLLTCELCELSNQFCNGRGGFLFSNHQARAAAAACCSTVVMVTRAGYESKNDECKGTGWNRRRRSDSRHCTTVACNVC